MANFDAEVRMSLRQIQASTDATSAAVTKLNATLRQSAVEVRSVAAGHNEAAVAATRHANATSNVTHELHGMGKGAAFAGGHGGHLVHTLFRLASFNPIAIAAGLGIGFMADKIMDAVHNMHELNGEVADLAQIAHDKNDAATLKARLGVDLQGARKANFDRANGEDAFSEVPDEFKAQAKAAATMAVQSGGAANEGEAVARMVKAGAFRKRASGAFGDASPAPGIDAGVLGAIAAGSEDSDFGAKFKRATMSGDFQAIQDAAAEQNMDSLIKGEKTRSATEMAAGGSAASAALTNIENLLREQNAIIKREHDNAWFGATSVAEAAASARVADLQTQQNTILTQIGVSTR